MVSPYIEGNLSDSHRVLRPLADDTLLPGAYMHVLATLYTSGAADIGEWTQGAADVAFVLVCRKVSVGTMGLARLELEEADWWTSVFRKISVRLTREDEETKLRG